MRLLTFKMEEHLLVVMPLEEKPIDFEIFFKKIVLGTITSKKVKKDCT